MKPSLLTKLETLSDRHEEVSALLSDSQTISDQNKFRELSREYAELEPVITCYTPPTSCAACGSNRLRMVGLGTEKVEEELALLLPDARVARMA